MIYCPNPECTSSISEINCQNHPNSMTCQVCKTDLTIRHYQLIEPLQRKSISGSTEVFIVKDLYEINCDKVMKILQVPDQKSDNGQKILQMFDREARALRELNHPGIPKIETDGYFLFQTATGLKLKCLVMEKIDGINLEQWIQENQSFSSELALQWLEQLVDILEHLHQNQLFHRDIKPANIMLRTNGKLALVDFGAVRWITTTVKGTENLTAVFTAGYAPPEQLDRQAVPQSDFYALGRTFVHLLTGQNPLNFSVNHGRLRWRDPNLRHFAKLVANLVDRLMTTMVEERPQNTALIRQQIEEVKHYQPRLWRIFSTHRQLFTILMSVPFLMLRCSDFRPVNSATPFISYGEKSLFTKEEVTPQKQAGINAFAQNNYPQAINNFQKALEKDSFDSEAKIFLHNARIGHQKSRTLAISISSENNTRIKHIATLKGVTKMLDAAKNIKIAILRYGDANDSQRAARDLVKQPDVIGVVTVSSRSSKLAAEKIYCKEELVNIVLDGRATGTQDRQCKDLTFHLLPSERLEAEALTQQILSKMKRKRVAVVFWSKNKQSVSIKSEFDSILTRKGGKVVSEFDMNSQESLASSKNIQQALNKAEIIIVFPTISSFNNDNLLKVLMNNQRRSPILGGSGVLNSKMLEITKKIGGQGKGIIVATPCCSKIAPNGHWREPLTQDAIKILITASQQQPTSKGIHRINQILSDPDFKFEGKSGLIRFSQDGDRHITNPEFVQILPNPRSDKGYSFVPLRQD